MAKSWYNACVGTGSRAYVEEFLSYLGTTRNFSYHTIRSYRADLEHFVSYVGRAKRSVLEVDHRFLRRYVAFLATLGYSRRTISRRVACLKSFYRFLKKAGHIASNPADSLSGPKLARELPRHVSENAVDALLAAIGDGDPLAIRDRALIDLLYSCGLRISEALDLDLQDVDLRAATIRVTGKGRKERVIPLPEATAENLRDYLGRSRPLLTAPAPEERAFFVSVRGRRLTDTAVRKRLRSYLKDPHVSLSATPHTFRHSIATHLLERGVDVRIVQETLGHASLATTQVYTHLSRKGLQSVYRKGHPRA
jgi:tyrosine recombinase XerC